MPHEHTTDRHRRSLARMRFKNCSNGHDATGRAISALLPICPPTMQNLRKSAAAATIFASPAGRGSRHNPQLPWFIHIYGVRSFLNGQGIGLDLVAGTPGCSCRCNFASVQLRARSLDRLEHPRLLFQACSEIKHRPRRIEDCSQQQVLHPGRVDQEEGVDDGDAGKDQVRSALVVMFPFSADQRAQWCRQRRCLAWAVKEGRQTGAPL